MKDLTSFVKNEIVKKNLLNDVVLIDSIDSAIYYAKFIAEGNYINIKCSTSFIKDNFIDALTTLVPNVNIINCNCTVNKFNENYINKSLNVFNNINHCKHAEILETISEYKGILIC